MALENGITGKTKLIGIVLSPSVLSGILTVFVTVLIVGSTILLAHIGGATQQSLLGLHSVYQQSSVGGSTRAVGAHLSSNGLFNNGILFLLWGSVGLVVYSIVQGVITELQNTDQMLHELQYVHVDRHQALHEAVLRAIAKLAALAAWWILAWFMFRTIIPYAVASAHLTALHYRSAADWLRTLLGSIYCLLGFHGLVVLLRLIVLRPRLGGNSILDTSE